MPSTRLDLMLIKHIFAWLLDCGVFWNEETLTLIVKKKKNSMSCMRLSIKVGLFSNAWFHFLPWGKILHNLLTSFPKQPGWVFGWGRVTHRPWAPRCNFRPLRIHVLIHSRQAQLSGKAPALRKNKETPCLENKLATGHRICKTKRGLNKAEGKWVKP